MDTNIWILIYFPDIFHILFMENPHLFFNFFCCCSSPKDASTLLSPEVALQVMGPEDVAGHGHGRCFVGCFVENPTDQMG